jgi:hypothetical protein
MPARAKLDEWRSHKGAFYSRLAWTRAKIVRSLPVAAPRGSDESQGRFYWEYRFTPFGPHDRKDGYDVFVCQFESDEAAKDCLNDFGMFVSECLYADYVRCLPPTILIDSRDGRSSTKPGGWCLINVWA